MALSRTLLQSRALAALVLTALLSACGGGSGGGNNGSGGTPAPAPAPAPAPDPAPGFSVSIDRAELRFTYEEGSSYVLPQFINGNGAGPLPAVIYAGAQDLSSALQNATAQISGTQLTFGILPKLGLVAGEYQGKLRLFACADEACRQHYKGSPMEIPYTVTINRGLKLTPSTMQMESAAGVSAKADVTVQLPTGATGFAATTSTPWLQVSNITSTSFSLSTTSKAPGNYSGWVEVSAGGRQVSLSVSYTSKSDGSSVSAITPERTSVSLSAAATTGTSQTLKVALPSWATPLSASVNFGYMGGNWLKVDVGPANTLTFNASAAGLAAGNYSALVELSAGPEVRGVSVPVSFTVLPADWAIAGTSGLTANAASSAASLTGELKIDVPNLAVQGYTISSSASWLKLSRTSGSTRTDAVRLSIDTAQLLTMENFAAHTAELTVSLASGKVTPAKFLVTLHKQLPEVHFISPSTRLPGEAGTYIVRGRGFDAVGDLNAALKISGAAPTSITRVDDTQLNVLMPAAQQGETSFSLSNALGTASGSSTLKVVAQPAMSAAAVATAGHKGSLVYDAERQALVTVNKTLGSVMRFKRNGASWDVDSASVPGAEGVALSPDGASLVVTSTTGQILLLDPVTLQRQGSYKASYIEGYERNSLEKMAVRNDGKVFFAGGSGVQGGGGMAYFDLATRKFGNLGGSHQFGWVSASGDGSRLNIVQSASYSPAPPMVHLDSNDTVAKPSTVGIEFWYEAAQSLRGERFVQGTYMVWDREFNKIGKVNIPDTAYFGRTPLLSPDGKRLYVMAYSTDGLYASSTVKPRVYVFDTSTRVVTSTDVPLLGYFELAAYPTCQDSGPDCNTRALGTISPDGKTLFFVGDARLLVVPVPATLTPARLLMKRLAVPGMR